MFSKLFRIGISIAMVGFIVAAAMLIPAFFSLFYWNNPTVLAWMGAPGAIAIMGIVIMAVDLLIDINR